MKKPTDEGVKILVFSTIMNALLFFLKGTVGLIANSTALQADAVNSAGDMVSSLVSLLGVKYAIKPYDEEHHYGHGKMEALVSLFIGLVILVGVGLLWLSIIRILLTGNFLQPNILALVVALIAILIKLFMYFKVLRIGTRINSIAVKANALDHRNDVFATSATALAISLSLVGQAAQIDVLKYAEPVAAAIMSIFIIKTGINILSSSVKMLMDAAPNPSLVEEIKDVAVTCEGVKRLNWLKCRMMGRSILVDLAVEVDKDLSVQQGHDIADQIKQNILDRYPETIDVLVHINPFRS